MFEYQAELIKVIDGDTVDLKVDLGFGIWRHDRFRLYGPNPLADMGLNAPEPATPEGKAARAFLSSLLDRLSPTLDKQTLIIQTIKKEKYGRYLAVIYYAKAGIRQNVNQAMLDAGHAALKKY